MYKTVGFMLTLVLACSMSLIAQTDTSNDSMKKSDSAMGKKTSITGCISENNGKYMIMDKNHPNGVELMTSEDLKPHVGHKVKVTGMMENMSGAMSSNNNTSNDNGMKHGETQTMTFKVTDMKMMSEQCDMSKMMNK